MTKSNRFSAPLALAVALAIPVFAQGCSAADALCCKDPLTVDLGLEGQAKASYTVFAQTAVDISAVASGSLIDVTNACRSMAIDMEASAAQQADANSKVGAEAMSAWCNIAVAQLNAVVKAKGAIKIDFKPPACQASVSAKANCQAKCDVNGKCDIKANPPVCTGGKLEVACKGECTAKAGATLSCEGSCGAECKGSCQATGGVKCEGKCEGTCEAEAGGGTGSGIQANGTCKGICKGTCEVTAPGVKCEGSCKGSCSGSCTGSANASVKCDGECKGEFEPIKCEGGKLEGGCKVDAKCDANCDASVSAKAECTPPEVTITAAAGIDAKYINSIKANLPNLLVIFQARGEAFIKLVGTFVVDGIPAASGVVSAKPLAAGCVANLGSLATKASADMSASVQASGSVVGALK